jgi:hypothetical protein
MREPKKVLLVTNSASDSEIAEIKQAVMKSEKHFMSIKLSLVQVIPTLPTCYFNIPSMVLLAERYYEEAKQTLTCVGDMLNVPQRDQWLVTGRLRAEVLRLAAKLSANFILASSTSIQDLHKSFLFNRTPGNTPIKSINHLNLAL